MSSSHRPRNNLTSVEQPQFAIRDHKSPVLPPAASATWVNHEGLNSRRISELGDSSSLFSFDSPHQAQSFGAGHSPQFQSSDRASSYQNPIVKASATLDKGAPLPRNFNGPKSSTMPSPESEPRKGPLAPATANPQTAIQPTFGKTSTLQSPLRTSAFNIPKPNKPRPEHHRPVPQTVKPTTSQIQETGGSSKNPIYIQGSKAQVAKAPIHDRDIVEISKPANPPSGSTYPAAPKTFTSGVTTSRGFTSVNPSGLDRLINLDYQTVFENQFGAAEPYNHIDAAKATENIKALLEGAFEDEDEDDKPRTRGRKKKSEQDVAKLADEIGGLNIGTSERDKSSGLVGEEEDEEEDDGSVEGIKVKLLPHQVDGVAWMKEKESGEKKKNGVQPKGGILADDMGLGKTIQSIALIITHPRPPLSTDPSTSSKTDKKKLSNSVGKGTLVVAPLALIKQWEAEIANRVTSSHKLRVCVHHGPKRTKRFEDLRKYDVVITTYQVLVSEYSGSVDNDSGPQVGCFGIHWYRVILDEAHTIKNRNAKASQACYALRAEYRWCLTGTPMQNNLDELQSLIRFLRIKPYNELSVWRDQITRPMNAGRGGVAMKRLQFYLKAFMKRRTKDILKEEGALNPGGKASIKGEPDSGFKITERKIEDVICEFSENERTFYEKLQQRTDKSLEKMMDASKMSYASALVLLLRLRQACNHPELVGGDIRADKDALTTGQSNGSKKMSNGDKDVDDIADLLGGLSVQTKQCDVCQLDLTEEESKSGSIRCGICESDMLEFKRSKKVLEKGKDRRKEEKGKKTESLPRVRKNRNIIHDSDEDEEGEGEWIVAKNERHAPHLGTAGGQDDEDAESGAESLASDDTNSADETLPELDRLYKKKVINLIDSEADDDSSTSESEEGEEEDASEEDNSQLDAGMSKIPSAKVTHLLEILRRESKTHKFIVFSQFTSMLNLIEPFLRAEGLIFTRYDGSMRNDQREASLDRLRNEKKTRILLCSLKCGSLGLNLTAASRVVIMEPFWNPFVEEQAIDRVHRLNQTIDVIVYKLTIANSVEERILDLQDKKRALAEAAIEGEAGIGGRGAAGKLSMQDILNLFKRDAELDPRHESREDLWGKRAVLEAPAAGMVGGRKVGPGSYMVVGGIPGGREDDVYGRRW